MSKITISEIESLASNADLQVTPNGTGIFEVAGNGDDGTLQLNSASNSNSVKIKSPNDAAGQSYTMILPASNITADQFLQVGTVTGSGATAVGQLQQTAITPQDGTQLSASNVTSGTLSAERIGDLPASAGFGLKLISKATVTEDDTIDAITFTNFDDGGMYHIVLKNFIARLISTKDYATSYSSGITHTLRCYFLDSDGKPDRDIHTADTHDSSSYQYSSLYGGTNRSYVEFGSMANSAMSVNNNNVYRPEGVYGGIIELYSKAEYGYMTALGWGDEHRSIGVAGFDTDVPTKRIHGITFIPSTTGGFFFGKGTEILLYKYVEA